MQWTKEQQAIIDNRQGTLLVSAAAGSGKTAVLVQRILEWVVTDGRNIDEFLVVTFTRAAASQMRNKIRNALEKIQEEQPENQHIVKQLSLIHRASITTIDSFCKKIVDDNFQLLDLDPSMRIMEETEGVLMEEDVLTAVLEQAYEECPEQMMELHQYLNAMRSDENIRKVLRKIYRQAESFPYPEEWLGAARADAGIVDEETMNGQPWMRRLVADVKLRMAEVKELPERIRVEYENLDAEYRPKAYGKYCDYFAEECRMLEMIEQAESYTELQAAFDNAWRTYKRFSWKNSGVPESHYATELWEAYSQIRKDAASQVAMPMLEILRQQEETAGVLQTLIRLTESFRTAFAKEKQRKNCMDFGDVEHYALQVLMACDPDGERYPTEAAGQLQEQYTEIMIDEYQDSNDLQEAILTSIARRDPETGEYRNMFMVGDVKQSIYKFRMARPRLFQEKYQRFTDDLQAPGTGHKIELKQNFRSRAEVLESANLFFYQIMTEALGGIAYNEQVALVPGRVFPENEQEQMYRTELLMLDTCSVNLPEYGGEETPATADTGNGSRRKDAGDEEETQDQMSLEAQMTAVRIQELCGGEQALPVWDESLRAYRPCRYQDIVILLRTVRGWSDVFRSVLTDAGIPVDAESGKGYFDSAEVKDILCMLAVIDNARDDIALAGALRSPLAAVNSEELAKIRIRHRRISLWDAVNRYVTEAGREQDADPVLEQKLEAFLERVSRWKKQKSACTIRELIWDILNETGYFDYVGAMPNGMRRQGNILKLIEKATAYETTSYRGLFDFLRYIERVRVTEQDFGESRGQESSENQVHIMTIHKSKGLEFPVVFVCGCGKRFNQMDTEDTVLVDAECYLGVNYKNLEQHYYEKTSKRNYLSRYMREENLAEELRILYVAMTRAQEKLILVGSIDRMTAKNNEAYRKLYAEYLDHRTPVGREDTDIRMLQPLTKTLITKCNSYLTWFIQGIAQLENRGIRQTWMEYRIVEAGNQALYIERTVQDLLQRAKAWEEYAAYPECAEIAERIAERFGWKYPYPLAATGRGKLSVSEIKKMSQIADEEAAVELELSGEARQIRQKERRERKKRIMAVTDGATYGTLVHLAMEKLSFRGIKTREQVERELLEMERAGVLTGEERQRLPVDHIYHMVESELGQRMQAAEDRGQLYREQQFVAGIPMNEIHPDTQETDLELIQGVIDVYFEEDGELVLLDYKTDAVSAGHGEEELIKRYYAQLEYYRRILEQLTGKHVKETYIYSFSLEQTIRIPENLFGKQA